MGIVFSSQKFYSNMSVTRFILLALVIVVLTLAVDAKKKKQNVAPKGNCDICERVLNEIMDTVEAKKDKAAIETAIDDYCAKKKRGEERRVCYAIETLKRDVSDPITRGLPTKVVCQKLQKKYGEACSIKEEIKIDLRTVDLKSMRVKELKSILADHDLSCKGCSEKSAFIKLIQEEIIDKLPPPKEGEGASKAEL